MSDAQAAQVTENGAPSVEKPQVQETPGFKVFAGNLAYTTTDEGLRAFFAPVQNDILSVQVIMRGTRSAGYGFVALSSEEAAKKAAETLNKQELDGRQVIVEIAKPAEQKDKEQKEKKSKRQPRVGEARRLCHGEVTDAEANGEAPKAEEILHLDQSGQVPMAIRDNSFGHPSDYHDRPAPKKDKITWECNNGGQLWSEEAVAASESKSASMPGGFCAAGFSNINMALIIGLLVDIVCQIYMFFLAWRFSKRLEHYSQMQGPVYGGYYKA
ncbi:hypothetical protein NMY22_g11595 [Coprinellus aureogranulatus]|nr:hypothetical protein NMY22_g11595 [Coprinellus aureogranulatus]